MIAPAAAAYPVGGEVVAVAWQEADEAALLAFLTALALARDLNAEELGILAGFVVAVGDTLALLAVVLVAAEERRTKAKEKEAEEKLDKRLEKIEEQLKALQACCEKNKA